MATRSQVVLTTSATPNQFQKNINTQWHVFLYHHYDGYPEYMVPLIRKILNLPHWRKRDIEYLNAIFIAEWKKEEETPYTGHGVGTLLNTSIDYFYLVDTTSKSIYIYELNEDLVLERSDQNEIEQLALTPNESATDDTSTEPSGEGH